MSVRLPFRNAALNFHATSTGDATVDAATAYYGAQSMRFVRSGTLGFGRATVNGAVLSSVGVGDFTAECWARLDAIGGGFRNGLFSLGGATSGSVYYPYVYAGLTGVVSMGESTDPRIAGSASMVAGQWDHVAITRSGSTVTLWVGGVSQGTANTAAESRSLDSGALYLGASVTGGGSFIINHMQGNLHFRFTAGVARYTAPFTPPASFPADSSDPLWGNVTVLLSGDQVVLQPQLLPAPGTLQAFPPVWPAQPRLLPAPQMLRRVDWGGPGRVRGTVKIKGTPDAPVRRVVRLVRELDAVCVAQVLSHPITGEYEFNGFDPGVRYTVLAYDLPGGFRAAVASGVLPEPLPL